MQWFRRKGPDPQVCPTCGKAHVGLLTDFSYVLPDVVWALPLEERQPHLDWSTDLCVFENRWYIRGVFETPFRFETGRFGWGVWVEVSEATMARYHQTWEIDGSSEPRHPATLANRISFFGNGMAVPVEIQFGPANQRPLFFALSDSSHPLAVAQREGLSHGEYHAILDWIHRKPSC